MQMKRVRNSDKVFEYGYHAVAWAECGTEFDDVVGRV